MFKLGKMENGAASRPRIYQGYYLHEWQDQYLWPDILFDRVVFWKMINVLC